ncbi:ATP-binding cassette domain-containing protein [Mycetocola zhadangensis]|uniref:ATP-binding cassette domain-containing protein n=1 Tax=Mycetocola zhadangensis TaxID=1164595 RepID=A0A3L7IT38_9MICO|nr:ATP-binding cassette domain-containing protein [Mycetocola zhadangensis]RLQ81414.1 ATP-binding cassette domain-containing protein [Mycetocola zhadangensis]GGF01922.1 daunorubicin resistance protein DrrA family ABC transporter ATP-binding protein [Mycetocola zhadangensis]
MIAVELRGVRKSFGTQRVLDDIDLSVPAGSVFALLGPNGAGKTTVVNILATLVAPDSGTASVGGYDVRTARDSAKGVLSLTGQSVAVDEVLTGSENLIMVSRLWGLSRRESRLRARALLEQFDLADAARRQVKTYSGGMRRRLDLALSLIRRPEVLFLDEPTTGLDTRSRRSLWAQIRDLRSAGTTIFLTTQYLEEAEQLADRVAVLAGGRIVADGTPAELKSQVGEDVVEIRSADDELLGAVATDGSVDGLHRAITQLAEVAQPDATVSLRSPSLEDVFLSLTGPALQQKEVQS